MSDAPPFQSKMGNRAMGDMKSAKDVIVPIICGYDCRVVDTAHRVADDVLNALRNYGFMSIERVEKFAATTEQGKTDG